MSNRRSRPLGKEISARGVVSIALIAATFASAWVGDDGFPPSNVKKLVASLQFQPVIKC